MSPHMSSIGCACVVTAAVTGNKHANALPGFMQFPHIHAEAFRSSCSCWAEPPPSGGRSPLALTFWGFWGPFLCAQATADRAVAATCLETYVLQLSLLEFGLRCSVQCWADKFWSANLTNFHVA